MFVSLLYYMMEGNVSKVKTLRKAPIIGDKVSITGPNGSKLIGREGTIKNIAPRPFYDDAVFLVDIGYLPVYPKGPTEIWLLPDQIKILEEANGTRTYILSSSNQ